MLGDPIGTNVSLRPGANCGYATMLLGITGNSNERIARQAAYQSRQRLPGMRDPGSDLEHNQIDLVRRISGYRQIIGLSELSAGSGALDMGAEIGGKFTAAEVQNRAPCHQLKAA
jgi:hypothetical protein